MSPAAREGLEWWLHEVTRWNGRSLQATPPELEIDRCSPNRVGSLLSGDPHWQPVVRGGAEPLHQRDGAASRSVFSESSTETDDSVLLKSDNVTTIAYINRLGGTRSQVLVNISKELWLWCLQRGIALKAQHLPGKENLNADFMSRHLRDRTNWILNPALFDRCGVHCKCIFLQRHFLVSSQDFSVGVHIRKRRLQTPSVRIGGTCGLMPIHRGASLLES